MKLRVEDHGTIWIIEPLDAEAQAFVDEHVNAEEWSRVARGANGDVIAFDWRQGRDFARFAQASGVQLVVNGKEVTIR